MDNAEITLLKKMYQKSIEDIQILKIQREMETHKMQLREKDLEQQAHLLEVCFDHSLSPMAILDKNFNFVKVNPLYAQLEGKKVSDFPGRNHFDFYPSDAKAIFENVLKTKVSYSAKGKPFKFEKSPQKGIAFWDWSLVPVLDRRNEIEYLILSLIDVTEKVTLSEEMNLFFNRAPIGLLITDLDGWIKRVNEACGKLLNMNMNNLDNIYFPECIKSGLSTSDYAFLKEKVRKMISGVRIQQCELPYMEPDGGVKWFSCSLVACPERKLGLISIEDISDKKAVEEDLKNTTQLFEDILNSVSVGLMSIDFNWKITYLNKMAKKNMFKPFDEVIGKNIWETYPALKDSPLYQAYHAVMNGSLPVRLQIPGAYSGNYYETYVYPSKNGITVFYRDITESKKLEEELHTNEKRMETLLQLSHLDDMPLSELVTFALSEGAKITSSSVGWLGILNQNQTEAEFFLWEDGKADCFRIKNNGESLFPIPCVDYFWQVVRMRRPFIVKESKGDRISKKTGKTKKLDNRIVIPIYENRQMVLVGGVANKKGGYQKVDVKQFALLLRGVWKVIQKHRIEGRLKESEERFYKIFELNPGCVTLQHYDTYTYCEANKNFEIITGFTREEVLGKSPWEIKIIDEQEMSDKLSCLRETGCCKNREIKLHTKSGEEKTILISMEVIEINNQKLIISVFNDITERKRMEREMARLDRLNSIGQMSAGISHEIRNPLSVIRGFLQLLSEKDDLLHYGEEFQLMIGELDRASSIITEFLSLARNKPIDIQLHDLNGIIESLCPLLQADGMIRDQTINLELGGIPHILVDEKEIRQLILNLSRNGMEAMDSGQVLTIRTSYVDGGVVLSISDQGKGIDPEVIEHIGTPFFTTKAEGTGLGLAICYGIVARHEAVMTFETDPKGTTFWVQFNL